MKDFMWWILLEGTPGERMFFVSATKQAQYDLPESEMTDEELLELIDFYYKRDYSIQSENNPQKSSVRKCNIDENDAVNLSRESIKNVFGIDVSDSDLDRKSTRLNSSHE